MGNRTPTFQRVNVEHPDVRLLQDRLQEAFREILKNPILAAGDFRFIEIAGSSGASPTFVLQYRTAGTQTWVPIASFSSAGTITLTKNDGTAAGIFGGDPVYVYHGLRPLKPAPQAAATYPLGNDLQLFAEGPADVHIQALQLDTTATTSLTGGGGAQSVTVGSTKNFATVNPPGFTLILEPGTANEETVTAANWSLTDSTHFSITPTSNHTQPYTIRQRGSLFLDVRQIFLGHDSPAGQQVWLMSGNDLNLIAKFPNSLASSWPLQGVQWLPLTTGCVLSSSNPNGDYVIRNNNTASAFILQNAAAGVLVKVSELGANSGGVMAFGNSGGFVGKIDFDGLDILRVFGGGTTPGLLYYGSQGGTGTGGRFIIRDNATDNNTTLDVDTAAKTVKVGSGGTGLKQILQGNSGSLAFGTVNQDTTSVQSFALSGAATSGAVAVSPTAQLPAGVSCYGWVSSAGNVSIAVVNSAANQAVTATFNVSVVQ